MVVQKTKRVKRCRFCENINTILLCVVLSEQDCRLLTCVILRIYFITCFVQIHDVSFHIKFYFIILILFVLISRVVYVAL